MQRSSREHVPNEPIALRNGIYMEGNPSAGGRCPTGLLPKDPRTTTSGSERRRTAKAQPGSWPRGGVGIYRFPCHSSAH